MAVTIGLFLIHIRRTWSYIAEVGHITLSFILFWQHEFGYDLAGYVLALEDSDKGTSCQPNRIREKCWQEEY